MTFHAYKPLIDFCKSEEHCLAACRLLGRDATQLALHELAWTKKCRPYCKVYPAIADELADADMDDLPVSEFPREFRHIEIALPATARWKGSILLCQERKGGLGIIAQLPSDAGDPVPDSFFAQLDLSQGETIGQCISSLHAQFAGERDPHDHDAEYERVCWRVAISVALFLDDNHRLVLPDLEPRVMPRARHLDGRKTKGKLLPRPVAMTLGREIELPRPVPSHADPTGGNDRRELRYAHHRRGAWRMQPCGERGRDRKRIWIGATVVRADLPMSSARRGYVIPGRREVA